MGREILAAVALVLVIEGLVLSISPGAWKQAMRQLLEADESRLRLGGIGCMAAGALLLAFSR